MTMLKVILKYCRLRVSLEYQIGDLSVRATDQVIFSPAREANLAVV